ncbi:MAG: type I DNA topoisomerase [Muribaculaceae bacterium]|nr:type I DNA topoisomerase [Muribaculaceae bacterium]
MQSNLVIVESPAKAKTIEKFLGKEYKVLSSYGHIRDLKKRDFSIDVEKGFMPIYEVPSDKKQVVDTLKKAAKDADMVWLASDEDREGEAIAWHLYEVLGLTPEKTRRIVFHEITKNAILSAIEKPRDIDVNLVNAQQARRVLDRIVGFELSPILWRKIKPALSAGRVQSVAVRLIVEREREIEKFSPEASFRITAMFKDEEGNTLKGELQYRPSNVEEAEALLQKLSTEEFEVSDISVKPLQKYPAPPFTTSTLQQEAARKLGFTVAQTMRVAQQLYEAGLITYMRTDSVNLSSLAINTAKDTILENFGKEYSHPHNFSTNSKGAQEAHEAIRPTYIANREIEGNSQEKRLYDLIWKRTVASQMTPAQTEKTTISVQSVNGDDKFIITGEVIKFDGFLHLYVETNDDESEKESETALLPPMKKGDKLTLSSGEAVERFTMAPPRYSEASLVHKLEELGIGRPSTYAPTISTIQQREYVEKGTKSGVKREYKILTLKKGKVTSNVKSENVGSDKGKLIPTDIGIVVNDYLTENFPDILNYNFTAKVEEEFDSIADGENTWNVTIASFYETFHPEVLSASSQHSDNKVGERILGTDPTTGRRVSVKIGRFGPVVQIGTAEDAEKPVFASLMEGQTLNNITLEQALKLFALPRTLGAFEDKEVVIGVGKFGPYIRHDGKFTSLPKEYQPLEITLEEAVQLIVAKRSEELSRILKTFDEEPELQIINGRYGAYIAYNKSNYKLPKGAVVEELTLEDCKKIIAEQGDKPAKKTTRKVKAKK